MQNPKWLHIVHFNEVRTTIKQLKQTFNLTYTLRAYRKTGPVHLNVRL